MVLSTFLGGPLIGFLLPDCRLSLERGGCSAVAGNRRGAAWAELVSDVNGRNDLTSVALSGRVSLDALPRPKDLGYSVQPFHGSRARRVDATLTPEESLRISSY
jgi:hypothetical protein